MAKKIKSSSAAVVVTEENIASLCETIPTARPTSEFSEKKGIVFNIENESGVSKQYVFVGESVIEKEGVWSKASETDSVEDSEPTVSPEA